MPPWMLRLWMLLWVLLCPSAPALPLLPPALPPAALRLDDRVVGMMDSLLWLL